MYYDTTMTPLTTTMTIPIEDRIKAEAKAHGFSLVGIAPATVADGFGRFCDWLDRGVARCDRSQPDFTRDQDQEHEDVLFAGAPEFPDGHAGEF